MVVLAKSVRGTPSRSSLSFGREGIETLSGRLECALEARFMWSLDDRISAQGFSVPLRELHLTGVTLVSPFSPDVRGLFEKEGDLETSVGLQAALVFFGSESQR